MNVVAYTRVSADGQAGDDEHGIESQRRDILAYCEAYGMTVVRWFIDKSADSSKLRPKFDEIVYGNSANTPPFKAVIVARSDCVSRDINAYYYYKLLLMKKNLELISVTENFGQLGSFSKILEAFTRYCVLMESESMVKRTSAGRKVKAARGEYSGGRAPMGYRVENGALVIASKEAEIVRWVFELRDRGTSMQGIVDWLNEHGYLTRAGKEFVISTVQSILNNRKTYEGYYRYGKNGEWVRGQQAPILEETT